MILAILLVLVVVTVVLSSTLQVSGAVTRLTV